MEKLAEQVIDFYDDPTGEILKRRFPTEDSLPEVIKEGAFLDDGERGRIRDELYALVMKNGDEHMRKFACTDACNTALSVIYLMDHAKDALPEPVVKTAAQNLMAACKLYDLIIPNEIEKLAGALPDEISPHIDVTNMEVAEENAPSAYYGLQKEAKYPIHSYDDIRAAQGYLEKYASQLHPSKRREFSLNLADRMEELGLPISGVVEKYASDGWAPDIKIRGELHTRMEKVAEEDRVHYKALFTKVGSVSPGVFANMLMEIDEEVGLSDQWDDGISDPFSAVLEKQANTYSYQGTGGYVDEEDLNQIKGYRELLSRAFGEDFVGEFTKNPIVVFKALPNPEKETMIKLVASAKKW